MKEPAGEKKPFACRASSETQAAGRFRGGETSSDDRLVVGSLSIGCSFVAVSLQVGCFVFAASVAARWAGVAFSLQQHPASLKACRIHRVDHLFALNVCCESFMSSHHGVCAQRRILSTT